MLLSLKHTFSEMFCLSGGINVSSSEEKVLQSFQHIKPL